ncbi:TldD/PmbA family protein [Dehalococcoidia bacterium]|nr:TldD/PmbA family protein [Dehalococcoidia bacterium]
MSSNHRREEMTRLLDLGERAVKKSLGFGADEAEAFLIQGREISVQAENNEIKVATSQVEDGIGIRVFSNKGLGFASVNVLNEKEIEEAARDAVRLSQVTPRDEYNILPEPKPIKRVPGLYDDKIEGLGLDKAISLVEEMLAIARDYDSRVIVELATFDARVEWRGVVSSRGIREEEQGTHFLYCIEGMARDGEEVSSLNYRLDSTRLVGEIDVKRIALEFAKSVVDSLGAKKGETFRGTVILSPNAVAELMTEIIIHSINANNVQKGMSKWAGKLDERVASSMLTLEDNGLLEGGAGSYSFDREGLPPTALKIIEDGYLRTYMYNTYTARKEGRRSTGHASGGARGLPSIGPTNLIVKAGDKSKDELISEIKEGVLVTRFAGTANPVSGDFSGVVKGGFLIKDGEITNPLIETLMAGNLFELLPRISGLSRETERIESLVAPYVRIEEVSITGG